MFGFLGFSMEWQDDKNLCFVITGSLTKKNGGVRLLLDLVRHWRTAMFDRQVGCSILAMKVLPTSNEKWTIWIFWEIPIPTLHKFHRASCVDLMIRTSLWYRRLCECVSCCRESSPSHESRLITHLQQRYEKMGKQARPLMNSSQTLTVEFGCELLHIVELDEVQQTLVSSMKIVYVSICTLLFWLIA